MTKNKKKILVVDDSATNNILLQSILEEEGYFVNVAFDGKEAFQFLKTRKPDLILLDIMMPEIDGLSILREIKKKNTEIPVIMVTAKDDLQSQDEAKSAGALDYIQKPINVDLVIDKVKQLFSN